MFLNVEFNDVFELLPIYSTMSEEEDVELTIHQHREGIEYLTSPRMELTEKIKDKIWRFEWIKMLAGPFGKDDLVCYVYLDCLDQNCLTVCFRSIYETRHSSSDYVCQPYLTFFTIDETETFTAFHDSIVGVLKVKDTSPIHFRSMKEFTEFLPSMNYDNWDRKRVRRIMNVPISVDLEPNCVMVDVESLREVEMWSEEEHDEDLVVEFTDTNLNRES